MRQAVQLCALALPLVLLPASHTSSIGAQDQNLCEELRFLGGFLGEWTGRFDDPNETLEIRETWTAILNGQGIRRIRRVPEAEQFEAEAVYFYDRAAATVRFVLVTNNGYVNRGVLVYDGHAFTQTGEQILPDGSTRSTSGTYRFRDNDTVVEEGGHTIIFVRSQPG